MVASLACLSNWVRHSCCGVCGCWSISISLMEVTVSDRYDTAFLFSDLALIRMIGDWTWSTDIRPSRVQSRRSSERSVTWIHGDNEEEATSDNQWLQPRQLRRGRTGEGWRPCVRHPGQHETRIDGALSLRSRRDDVRLLVPRILIEDDGWGTRESQHRARAQHA